MIRRFKIAILLFIFWGCVTSYADEISVTPETYKITVNKVEVHNATTGAWVTLGQGDMTFDVASVSAGATAGGYVSGKAIPSGTYDQVRVTVYRHMTIKAHYNDNGTDYYTTSTSQEVDLDPDPVGEDTLTVVIASTNASSYDEGDVVSPETSHGDSYNVIGDYFTDTQTFSTPFTIKKGVSSKLKISFDVTGSATLYTGDNSPPFGSTPFFYPGAPTISITVE